MSIQIFKCKQTCIWLLKTVYISKSKFILREFLQIDCDQRTKKKLLFVVSKERVFKKENNNKWLNIRKTQYLTYSITILREIFEWENERRRKNDIFKYYSDRATEKWVADVFHYRYQISYLHIYNPIHLTISLETKTNDDHTHLFSDHENGFVFFFVWMLLVK